MLFYKIARFCEHTFLTDALGPSAAVVDLGVNRGEFSRAIIRKFGCHVWGAEPASAVRQQIPADPLLTVLPLAVTGSTGAVDLNVHERRCATILPAVRGEPPPVAERVETVTFAEFLRRAGLETVDLVKVDIEGAEIDMFETASDFELRRMAQFTVEFHDFIYPDLSSRVARIKKRLQKLGFCSINFSLDNTDVLFLNRSMLRVSLLQYAWLAWVIKYKNGVTRRVKRALQPT